MDYINNKDYNLYLKTLKIVIRGRLPINRISTSQYDELSFPLLGRCVQKSMCILQCFLQRSFFTS